MIDQAKIRYNILMLGMSYYDDWQNGIVHRNYFVLQELLARDEVNSIISVDYLPLTWRTKLKAIQRRLAGHCSVKKLFIPQIKIIDSKLTAVSFIKTGDTFNFLNELIQSRLSITGQRLILWSYFPLFIEPFLRLPADYKIFDAVDDWSQHPAYRAKSQLLKHNYQQILQAANLIFTVSDDLRKNLFAGSSKPYFVPNGTNIKPSLRPEPIIKRQPITVGYVGTIQSRIDFELIEFIAKQHSDKQFVFVGPVWKDAQLSALKKLPNVKFIGRVAFDKIGYYLTNFDVAIIPHKIDGLTKSMDPMKFYDYLSAGLPIISTQKIVDDPKLQYYAPSANNFSQAINLSLRENNQELAAYRQAYSQQNSWRNRVEAMLKIISEKLID